MYSCLQGVQGRVRTQSTCPWRSTLTLAPPPDGTSIMARTVVTVATVACACTHSTRHAPLRQASLGRPFQSPLRAQYTTARVNMSATCAALTLWASLVCAAHGTNARPKMARKVVTVSTVACACTHCTGHVPLRQASMGHPFQNALRAQYTTARVSVSALAPKVTSEREPCGAPSTDKLRPKMATVVTVSTVACACTHCTRHAPLRHASLGHPFQRAHRRSTPLHVLTCPPVCRQTATQNGSHGGDGLHCCLCVHPLHKTCPIAPSITGTPFPKCTPGAVHHCTC